MRIGIRREDKNQWEARVPLIPQDVKELLDQHSVEFVVQPSVIRAFKDAEYTAVGATIEENLASCDVILAVKEVPVELLIPGKIYIYFSHTIKGQSYNMKMLARLMELKNTLFDYECIVDQNNHRLIFFGRFAGIAGMINSFWALGRRLDYRGFKTPFANLKQALQYQNLEEATADFKTQAALLKAKGLPEEVTPLIIGFSGYGNVSRGAQEIFDLFQFEELDPNELDSFIRSKKFAANKLYKVVFKEEHLVAPKDPEAIFNLNNYYENPENYVSIFEKYLSYLTILVNAIYWDYRYPRLVTKKYLGQVYRHDLDFPLQVIGDITCDINGSIECNVTETDSGNPLYVYDPLSGDIHFGVEGIGPVILAVDNLPCELPKSSSTMFSHVLKRFIPDLIKSDFNLNYADFQLTPELKHAVIVYKGQLTPNYRYLNKFLKDQKILDNRKC